MSDLSGNKFVLSHDHSGYDFTGNIDKLIAEESTREWIKSYISMLLSYASDPKYITSATRTKSHFVKDGYIIMMESYAKRDNRLFIESEITIEKADVEIAFENYYKYSNSDFSFKGAKAFYCSTFFLMLNAFVSDSTTFFCLVNDDITVKRIHGVLSEIDYIFLKNNSCIEVIKEIPPIKNSVAICHCIQPQDKDNYIREIERNENYIVADFTGVNIIFTSNLNSPTYAQRCFKKLSKYYGEGKYEDTVVYNSFANIVNKYLGKKEYKTSMLNALCYIMMETSYRECLFDVAMTESEKNEFKQIFERNE